MWKSKRRQLNEAHRRIAELEHSLRILNTQFDRLKKRHKDMQLRVKEALEPTPEEAAMDLQSAVWNIAESTETLKKKLKEQSAASGTWRLDK